MTRLYFSILISFGTPVTDPSYAQISPDSDPLPTLTFATSPPDTSTAGFNTGLTSSLRWALTSSRSLTHRPAFNSAWSGGQGVLSLYSQLPCHAPKFARR